MVTDDDLQCLGHRLLQVKEYDGANWLVGSVHDDGTGQVDITTDHIKASELADNEVFGNLFAGSLTGYHANVLALDAILNSRPPSEPLTDKEKEAVRWLRSAIKYTLTGDYDDPDLRWKPVPPPSDAPGLPSEYAKLSKSRSPNGSYKCLW